MLKKLPVPVCGLALGLASLGNLLAPFSLELRYACGVASLLIVATFTIRALTDFSSIKEELKNPVAFSVLPTYTMAIMLLSGYMKSLIVELSHLPAGNVIIMVLSGYSSSLIGAVTALWFAALALQLVMIAAFTISFVVKFSIKQVFPSWFVMFVGIVVASVTSPAVGQQAVGRLVFFAGFALYMALLPVILYRVFKVGGIPEPARPTLAIFSAPASLCFVGYMSAFDEKSVLLASFLAILSVTFWLAVVLSMFKLLSLPFFPSYSAFTFPLVISATAFKLGGGFFGGALGSLLGVLTPVSLAAASAAVLYVLVRYCMYWFAGPKTEMTIIPKGN